MILPQLNPIEKALLGLMLATGLMCGGYWIAEHRNINKATKDEVRAEILNVQANAVQVQATHTDAEYQALVDAHASDQKRVDAAKAEVARLKAIPPVVITPDTPLDTAKDELITQLDKQVEDLKAEKATLIIDRDQWKATAKLRDDQATAQAAATKAWKDAVLQSRWLGRGEGAGAGLLLGLLIKH